MGSQVERIQTPIGPVAFARGVIEAWKALYGEVPSKQAIGVLWGQYMIETGGVAVWNYNVGNVKHVAGDGYNWIDLPGTWERINGQKIVLPEGDPGRLFRAYDNYGQAFRHHLEFLKKKYSTAWKDIVNGNARDFAYSLKAGRDGKIGTNDDYYTGDENVYAAAVERNYNNFVKGTYYDDALKQLSIVLGTVGKTQPSQSAPDSAGEQSHSDSGAHTTGGSPDDRQPTITKSPYDADWNIDKDRE